MKRIVSVVKGKSEFLFRGKPTIDTITTWASDIPGEPDEIIITSEPDKEREEELKKRRKNRWIE